MKITTEKTTKKQLYKAVVKTSDGQSLVLRIQQYTSLQLAHSFKVALSTTHSDIYEMLNQIKLQTKLGS